MADSGSFNADLGINMQFNIDNAGLTEMTKTIKEISKGKDLQRYWEDVETATNNAAKAMERYSKNTKSKYLAQEFIKKTNALKALTKNENISELFPDSKININELLESANKIVPEINSAFSVESFSQAFNTFNLLKDKGLELEDVFNKLSDYTSIVEKNYELNNENSKFKDVIGDKDISEIERKMSEIKKLRDEAEKTFGSFLKLNNIEKTDAWGDERFPKYIDDIREGTLTASEAIKKFKTEYEYLLEESFKSNNDTFGLEQLETFSNKLDSIFRQVEETSLKINDIISNGVIAKSVESLSLDPNLTNSQRSMFGDILKDEESLKSITDLFKKLIEESDKIKKENSAAFNDEKMNEFIGTINKMESALTAIRSLFVDIGDGEEFSPLMKVLHDISESLQQVKNTVGTLEDGKIQTLAKNIQLINKKVGKNQFNVNVKEDNSLESNQQTEKANQFLEKQYTTWMKRYDMIMGIFNKENIDPFSALVSDGEIGKIYNYNADSLRNMFGKDSILALDNYKAKISALTEIISLFKKMLQNTESELNTVNAKLENTEDGYLRALLLDEQSKLQNQKNSPLFSELNRLFNSKQIPNAINTDYVNKQLKEIYDIKKTRQSPTEKVQAMLDNVALNNEKINKIDEQNKVNDLQSVLDILNKINESLNELIKSAAIFSEKFENGFNTTSAIEEIDKLTNRVKELEDELSKIKLNPVGVDKSNISSGNETSNLQAQEKIYLKMASNADLVGKSHAEIKQLLMEEDKNGDTINKDLRDRILLLENGRVISEANAEIYKDAYQTESLLGKTQQEVLSILQKENAEIEAGNRLFRERMIYFKDGVVAQEILGDSMRVNGNYNKSVEADEFLHTHPIGKLNQLFSIEDMYGFYDEFSKGLKQFSVLSGNKLSKFNLSGLNFDSYDNFVNQYILLMQSVESQFKNFTDKGAVPSDKFETVVNNFQRVISKYITDTFGNLGAEFRTFKVDGMGNISDSMPSPLTNKLRDTIFEVSKFLESVYDKIHQGELSVEEAEKQLDAFTAKKFQKTYSQDNKISSSTPIEDVSSNISSKNIKSDSINNVTEDVENLNKKFITTEELIQELNKLLQNLNARNLDGFNDSFPNIFGLKSIDELNSKVEELSKIKKIITKLTRQDSSYGDNFISTFASNPNDKEALEYLSNYNKELNKLGYTLAQPIFEGDANDKQGSKILSAEIIPISDKAVTNAEEMIRILLDVDNLVKRQTPIKDVFQGGSSSAEKLEQDIKNVESATDRATESAKEYRKILSQVGEFDIDTKISAMYKRNDGQLESWTWRAKKDEDGNIIRDTNGQIDYNDPTITVISKYEQLEKIIVNADNELRNLQKDLAEIKEYSSTAPTDNIEAKISGQKEYIQLLEQTIKIIAQSDAYQQIIDARNKAAREYALTEGAKQEKSGAKQSASKEEKRLANIERVNRALNKQQIAIDLIEKTYNKNKNKDLDRYVRNPNDIDTLTNAKSEIQSLIDKLKGQARTSVNEEDFQKLDRLISSYKQLAKDKLKANNPSKQQLGGQNLDNLISQYDKLIYKAEKYGKATKEIVENLKKQRDILAYTSSNNSNGANKADVYYTARDNYKIESASFSAYERRNTEVNKALKQQLDAWRGIQNVREKISASKDSKEINNLKQIKKEYQQQYLIAERILKNNSDLYDKEMQLARLEQIRTETDKKIQKQSGQDLASYNKKYDKIDSAYESYENAKPENERSAEYTATLSALKLLKEEMGSILSKPTINTEDIDRLKDLSGYADEYTESLKRMKSAQKGSSEIARAKELDKISKYLKENTKLSRNARAELNGYLNLLRTGGASVNVEDIHNKFLKVVDVERAAGREGKTFLDIFKNKALYGFASQLAMYYMSIYDFIRYTRNAVTTIVELDDSLIDLKKTTAMTSNQLDQFYLDANKVAKQMGVTTKEIIDQASAWSRLNKTGLLYGDI